jgi:hypothetical protein
MAHVPSFPGPPETLSAQSLALHASDGIDSLRVVQRAYACIKKLIGPHHTSNAAEFCPDRTELSALVGLVNEEFQRRIDAADATAQSLRTALSEAGKAKQT